MATSGTTKKLYLVFTTAAKRRATITIDQPKEDLTTEDVKPVMQSLIDMKLFAPGLSVITDIADAYIRETTTTDLVD